MRAGWDSLPGGLSTTTSTSVLALAKASICCQSGLSLSLAYLPEPWQPHSRTFLGLALSLLGMGCGAC